MDLNRHAYDATIARFDAGAVSYEPFDWTPEDDAALAAYYGDDVPGLESHYLGIDQDIPADHADRRAYPVAKLEGATPVVYAEAIRKLSTDVGNIDVAAVDLSDRIPPAPDSTNPDDLDDPANPPAPIDGPGGKGAPVPDVQIGRASCRERV